MTELHGGGLARVAREFSIPVEDLLDFSASVNPDGPPPGVTRRLAREALSAELLARYPDPGLTELRTETARQAGVPEGSLVVAAGAAALIHLAVSTVRSDEALVPVPAFAEYRRALTAAGTRMVTFPLSDENGFRLEVEAFCRELARVGPGLAIVNNPHNPSGALAPRESLLPVLETAASSGTTLLLDEAFIDYAPLESLTQDAAAREKVILLRSLTKFYGMPALRVGYAVSAPATAARMRERLPPWPVGTLEQGAAVEALRDLDYSRRVREANQKARSALAAALEANGIRVFPSFANFLLLELPAGALPARLLRERLIRDHGILVRDCSSFEGLPSGRHLRVGVRRPRENERLMKALKEALSC